MTSFNVQYTGAMRLSTLNNMSEQFQHNVGPFDITSKKLKPFIKHLKKNYSGDDSNKCVTGDFSIFYGTKSAVSVQELSVVFFADDLETLEVIVNQYEQYFKEDVRVNFFFSAKGAIEVSPINISNPEMGDVYPELYPDIDMHQLLKCFGESNSTSLILLGMPGVGKTSFLRAMLKSGKYPQVAYVKGGPIVANQQTWAKLAQTKYDLIVFDDLDSELGSRGPFMTNLLSFSDGIFAKNSKIVITTNLEATEIDTALVRPGRCFDVLKLQPLKHNDALSVWTDVLGHSSEEFRKFRKGNGRITQAELMSWHEILTNSGGNRPYVKNPEASYAESGLDINRSMI